MHQPQTRVFEIHLPVEHKTQILCAIYTISVYTQIRTSKLKRRRQSKTAFEPSSAYMRSPCLEARPAVLARLYGSYGFLATTYQTPSNSRLRPVSYTHLTLPTKA